LNISTVIAQGESKKILHLGSKVLNKWNVILELFLTLQSKAKAVENSTLPSLK